MKIFLQNHYTLKIVLISSTAKNNQIYSKFQISFMNHDSASFYNYKILLHPSKQSIGVYCTLSVLLSADNFSPRCNAFGPFTSDFMEMLYTMQIRALSILIQIIFQMCPDMDEPREGISPRRTGLVYLAIHLSV